MATYTIDSVQDLIDLTLLSGKFAGVLWKDNLFNLTADLDLTGVDPAGDGKGWWPIGDWDLGDWFNGFFDGQGHTISNMTINRPARNHVGLFGSIDPVSGKDVDTWDNGAATEGDGSKVLITQEGRFDSTRAGMIATINWNDVTYSDGEYTVLASADDNSILVDLAFAGNIASGVSGKVGKESTLTNNPIKNLGLIDVNIAGKSSVGGMIGSCLGFNILAGFPVKNCYVTGTIDAAGSVVGGFIGSSNNGYFLDCYTNVDIIVTSTDGRCSLGSFVGMDSINTDCVNCYGVGSLTHIGTNNHNTYIGGLCGELNYDVVDYNADCAVSQGAGGKVLITKAGIFDEAAAGMIATVEWGVEAGSENYTDGWFNVLASDDNDSVLIDVDYVSDIASDVDVDIEDPSNAAYATDSFWDKETTGLDVDGRGDGDAVGKTTVEMKQEATFTNWDFTNDWWITEDETYPALRVFGGVPGLPTKASNPSPADDATGVAITTILSWSKDSGDNVLVYFDKKSENDPPTTKVMDDEEAILYDPPGDLVYNTTYVWRVDTKNEEGTTTGDQWEFTTVDLEVPDEPDGIVLVKGDGLLGSVQVINPQIVGDEDILESICPNEQDCDDTCSLIDVPNEYHPGTKDSVINF